MKNISLTQRKLREGGFALLLCLFAATLFAQAEGNYQSQQNQMRSNYIAPTKLPPATLNLAGDNEVEIRINALSNHEADSYTAIFSMVQVGKTTEETNALLNARLDAFLAGLKPLGIPDSNIFVDMVNFLPKYEYDVSKKLFSKKTYTEIPKGFELQKNVHVRYTDPTLLDRIVTAAARQDIYDIVKVDYFVKNPQARYAQLREASFKYLNQVKQQYWSIGMRLDSAYTVTAENSWVAYPLNRYESYKAYAAQRLDDNDNVKVYNADKTTSRFYNAVSGNDYDIVINPEILEPAVQFSYNLIVRFTLPERVPAQKTVVKKEFMLVTPNGEVKSLKIE